MGTLWAACRNAITTDMRPHCARHAQRVGDNAHLCDGVVVDVAVDV